MLASSIPYKFEVPWASGASTPYLTAAIPQTAAGAAASQTLGFPPVTSTPIGAGGTPPNIADINGGLNYETLWSQWVQAGGPIGYDAAFSAAIGGYPKGATLSAAVAGGYWVSTVDNNTSDPDTGGAGWQSIFYGLAPLASPTFTGVPEAPTAALGTDTPQLATMAALVQMFGSDGLNWFQIPNRQNWARPWIINFASVSVPGSGGVTWTYAKPFPNSVKGIVGMCNNASGASGPVSPLSASLVTLTSALIDFHLDTDVFVAFVVAIGN